MVGGKERGHDKRVPPFLEKRQQSFVLLVHALFFLVCFVGDGVIFCGTMCV